MFIIGVIFGIVLTLGFGKLWFERHTVELTEEEFNDKRSREDP